MLEPPSPGDVEEGAPNWSTTRDFGQAWNPDELREFNDYEWNRLGGGVGTAAGAGKKAGDITAANLDKATLETGVYTPSAKMEMRKTKLNIGVDALIPETSIRVKRMPDDEQTAARRKIALTQTRGVAKRPPPPPFNPDWEMGGDEMKKLYLAEHPEYVDVEMVRTGVNQ